MDVLKLLRIKNKCLSKFLKVSEGFLESIRTKDLSDLLEFHARRDSIIRAIDLFDRKISEAVARLDEIEKTNELKAEIERLITDKDEIIFKVLDVDARIMSHIGRESERIQREITDSQRQKDAIGRFKSGIDGEGGKLDREV